MIQCIPNFSEGRSPEVIEAIVGAIAACGAAILSVAPDAGHNRTVVAFAGGPEQVAHAALRATEAAARLIDLNHHRGSHPRMGATDVIPFVPISGCDMAECAALARRVGEAVGSQLGIPVFLYEEAALRPDRKSLAEVRRGEFEGLRETLGKDPALTPDFGPAAVHPTAGCTAVGARMPRFAFDVLLGTGDPEVAGDIAAASGCNVLGVAGESPDRTRVTIHIVNHQEMRLHRVLGLVASEAGRRGVPVVSTELAGLIPLDALLDVAVHTLRLDGFSPDQILEMRLRGVK